MLQEVRLQPSDEHKTRIRLWFSDDPAVGGRIELAHRIGVLSPRTEVVSRFTAAELHGATFFSEDNGYETIAHASGSGEEQIPEHHFPSQMSTFLSDGNSMLGVALARSHGVASLYNGTLDVMQHRRGGPYTGSGGTVVLDDADRTFSETWLSLGNASRANALRHENKRRLNRPLALAYAVKPAGAKGTAVDSLGAKAAALPSSLLLQSVRATAPEREELYVNLLHEYAVGELPKTASAAADVDLGALIGPFRPELRSFAETTLDGMIPIGELDRLHWNTTGAKRAGDAMSRAASAEHEQLTIRPFELRTFLARE